MTRYSEKDIMHETTNFWVLKVPGKEWYEVYKSGITHSTRVAIIGYKGEEVLNRAIAECNRRQEAV